MSLTLKKAFCMLLVLSGLLFLVRCSSTAKMGDTVLVDYTGRLEDGTVFDTSFGGQPLQFIVGSGLVISGFDYAVQGMKEGQEKNIALQPEAGYGIYDPLQVFTVPRERLPNDREPQVGDQLKLSSKEDGQQLFAQITAVTDKEVTVDTNHPLAGKTLFFTIMLREIK